MRKGYNFANRYDNKENISLEILTQLGEYQSGQLGRTVNPLTYVFTGSNPVSPTKCELQNNLLLLHSISKAGVAQLVERQPSKLQVAGSSLVSRSVLFEVHCVVKADVAQG